MAKKASSAAKSETEMLQEQSAHQESLQRLKKYKKKRKHQIIGLVLEVLLLCVVIVGYVSVSYVYDVIKRVTSTSPATTEATAPVTSTEKPTTSAAPTDPPPTLPIGPNVIQTTEEPTTPEPTTEEPTTTAEPTTPPPYTNPDPVRVPDYVDEYDTYICYGVDIREGHELERNTQGDVIIIVSIHRSSGEVRLASVYRDFCFEYAPGSFCKITDAYARYGATEVMNGLNRGLDLNISNYIVVNWTALADIVDDLGGVDVYVTLEEAHEMQFFIMETWLYTGREKTYGIPEEERVHHLDGVNAVAYARIRHNVGNDYARTERQRKLITEIVNRLKEQISKLNLQVVTKVVDHIADNMRTTIPSNVIISMGMQATRYQVGGSIGFPMSNGISPGTEYIISKDYLNDVKTLHEFLYGDQNYEPSENVRRVAGYHDTFTKSPVQQN